jgi:hypothetical protein
MGFYTDVIRERDRKDRELVINADRSLRNQHGDTAEGEGASGVFEALNLILSRYGLETNEAFGYKDINEALDLMLDPLGIIYDSVDLKETPLEKHTEYMLGFLEDGRAVALMPAVIGYRYVCPVTGEKGKVSKIKLQDNAYVIQRPIEVNPANLMTLLIYVLHLVSRRDIVLVLAATMLATGLGLVAPKMNQYVLDDLVPMGTDAYSLLLRALFLFILIGIIRTGISTAKTLGLACMRVHIPSEVQSAVMSRVLLMPQSFFIKTSAGKLSKQISNARLLSEQIINFVMGASLTAVFSLVYIPQMASFSPVLLLPALAVLLIKCLFSRISLRQSQIWLLIRA